MEEQKALELSFGEKLVGLSFNPSGDAKVLKAKQLCAELANLVYEDTGGSDSQFELSELQHHIYHHTIGEILNAQMCVVKLLTLKY